MKLFNGINCSFDYEKKSHILAIINLTPDSFSDGGVHTNIKDTLARTLKMIENGASIIDVGGESTRPQSITIDEKEEIKRIIPFIKALRKVSDIPISVDTRKSEVARCALDEGVNIVNDISGLKYDVKMAQIISQYKAGCILMHMRGKPSNMQDFTYYDNLIEEVISELQQSLDIAKQHNISENNIMLDIGIGFSKTTEQNLQLIKHLDKIVKLPYPILLGSSRKSFIGVILDKPNPQERLWGTAASIAVGLIKGARFFRVHNVAQMNDVIKITEAISNS